MKSIKTKANAKINLNLKIVGIKDGFHQLNSIFIPVDIYDELEIIIGCDADEICGMDIPLDRNIMYRCIKLLRETYKIKDKVKIIIKKNIPMMAGLGGGSSDAAAVLKVLNTLWNLNLSNEELIVFALQLGSDVPFFIDNKTSLIKGRGEIITPINIMKKNIIIIFNQAYFNTKKVFDKYDELNIPFSSDVNNIIDIEYVNDLEKAIICFDDSKKVFEVKSDLIKCGAYAACMSGSGGSVFGVFDKEITSRAYDKLRLKYNYIWKVKII